MTSPTNPSSSEIVNEMIARLRVLQGSGEFPPLTRRISGGGGLTGGGTLEADRTITLTAENQNLLTALKGLGDLSSLATDAEVTQKLAPYALKTNVAPRVYYREFSVMDAPARDVTAPPIRADNACTIKAVSVVAQTPGTLAVTVTVNGRVVTLAAGVENTTLPTNIAVAKNGTFSVKVAATDAAGIVVSLRCEEPGTV